MNIVVKGISHIWIHMGESVAQVEEGKNVLVRDVHRLARLGVRLVYSNESGEVVQNGLKSSFVSDVKAKQCVDQGHLCVPNFDNLREKILSKVQSSRCSIYPRATKMYRDLQEVYWWNGMKKDIAEFMAKCPNYQHVKVEHQKPEGPKLVHEAMEKVWLIRERLRMAQSRQKSYDDVREEILSLI
ncbi:hypothetical protein MTR67_003134 [Solanum verrucosum]|uniref:Integrase zinc-binding domain-containing protein n=1 Tax=Solanum verrucosum TaxID=315347 RepID=A0AAF0PRG4_SOLVR|nr:hypothetical protein MTR67_003134 [Solanum verrucosum]